MNRVGVKGLIGISTTQAAIPSSTDDALMQRYAAGEQKAFVQLYQRHRGALLNYYQRQCQNQSHVDEMLQDVWTNIISQAKQYKSQGRFKHFLFRSAHNRLIDYWRKQQHQAMASYDDEAGNDSANRFDEPLSWASHSEAKQTLLQLIKQLPAAQRETFLLKEEAGFNLADIALTMNCSEQAAKSRLRYATEKLRKGLLKFHEPA